MEQTSATRTELIVKKAQTKLARQGADLLRSKREALVREVMGELQSFASARETMHRAIISAVQSHLTALAIDGPEAVASAALACGGTVTVEIEEDNIWGTKVAKVKSDYSVRSPDERRYTVAGATARIDEAAERFERAVGLVLRIAPVERKLKALAEDIRKTSRRVNALEQRLLPRLDQQVRYIRNTLDQREREDVFRLKRLKGKGARLG